jgi:hypothetical protein
VSFSRRASPWMCGTAVLLLLTACSQQLSPSAKPRPELPPEAQIPEKTEFWIPRVTAGSRSYSISDSSTISINDDTTSRVLPIETIVHYSLTISPLGDSFSISGRVDSSKINSQIKARAKVGDSTSVETFYGVLTKQDKLNVVPGQQILSCSSSSNAMLSRVYELIIPYSTNTLRVGDKWSDTVSTTSCHGKTPLTQQIVREFEVGEFTTWQDRSAVKIQRSSISTFTGASSDANNHLEATGSGSSTATLFIDRNTSILLESRAQTKSMIKILSSRGQFPFTQMTSTHISIH